MDTMEIGFRESLAKTHRKDKRVEIDTTGTEVIPCNLSFFSKGLPHDSTGVAEPGNFANFKAAVNSSNIHAFPKLKLGGTRKLLNPSCLQEPDIIGRVRGSFVLPKPALYNSEIFAVSAIELYCMALCRDVNLEDFVFPPPVSTIAEVMGYLLPHMVIAPEMLFRSPKIAASCKGPYISQLLFLAVRQNDRSEPVVRKFRMLKEEVDYLTDWSQLLAVSNGVQPSAELQYADVPRYITTGRDLASVLYHHNMLDLWLDTYRVLKYTLNVPSNPGLPSLATEELYLSCGGEIDAVRMLSDMVAIALEQAWVYQWGFCVARPESYGLEVHYSRTMNNRIGLPAWLLNNGALTATFNKTGSYLLPMAYAEGCELSPSYVSGDATVAGACGILLKFLFDPQHKIPVMKPNRNGSELVGTDVYTTVGDEIDKMISNVALGQCFAGVNYRDDMKGVSLGEMIGIYYLRDMAQRYTYPIEVNIDRCNGEKYVLTNNSEITSFTA